MTDTVLMMMSLLSSADGFFGRWILRLDSSALTLTSIMTLVLLELWLLMQLLVIPSWRTCCFSNMVISTAMAMATTSSLWCGTLSTGSLLGDCQLVVVLTWYWLDIVVPADVLVLMRWVQRLFSITRSASDPHVVAKIVVNDGSLYCRAVVVNIEITADERIGSLRYISQITMCFFMYIFVTRYY